MMPADRARRVPIRTLQGLKTGDGVCVRHGTRFSAEGMSVQRLTLSLLD